LLYYLRPCRHEWFSEKISFTACAKSLKPWLAMALAMFAQSVLLSFSRQKHWECFCSAAGRPKGAIHGCIATNSIPFMQYAG